MGTSTNETAVHHSSLSYWEYESIQQRCIRLQEKNDELREELEKEVKLKLGLKLILSFSSLIGWLLRASYLALNLSRWMFQTLLKLETLNQMQKELAKGEVAQAKVEELLKFGMTLTDLKWPRMSFFFKIVNDLR